MADFLSRPLATVPDSIALADGERSWTYRELHDDVTRLARALRARGARPGVRVATLLPTSSTAVLAAHAIFRTGAVLAPLNPRLTDEERTRAVKAIGPALFLVERGGAEEEESPSEGEGGAHRPRRVDLEVLLDAVTSDAGAAGPAGAERAIPEASGPTAVLWTSGTAGRPRGVLLSSTALRAVASASAERLGLSSSDRWYASLSMAHVGGLALVVRAALSGSSLVVRGSYDTARLDQLLEEGEVTHASLVPTMLHQLLDLRGEAKTPPELRCLLIGGAHLPRPTLDRALANGYPVALTYGLTEATSQVATAPPELVRTKPGTVGPPLEGVEIRIDEGGEVLARGETLALGYLDPTERLLDEDGWLHTGDLGELDGDGHLWITGRTTDRIITGGVNVDPAEVEDVLRLHEGVRDVVVVGVPDPEWGETVAAAVVPSPGIHTEPTELEALARKRLTSAKLPRTVVFLEELPRTPTGKVDREQVRRRVLKAMS